MEFDALPPVAQGSPAALIIAQLDQARQVLNQFMADPAKIAAIEQAAALMAGALQQGGKIISCGNGGSHCDAMHFAEELSGRFRAHRPALAALAISDAAHITCTGNDYGFDHIFSRYVEGLGRPGDVLLAISTSGNSRNVLNAIAAARENNLYVVGLTGKDGGEMARLCDVEIRVDHHGYADRIQEVHIKAIHIMIQLIEHHLGHAS